ncbi:hypothetical protein DVS28_a2265 [Euzebya pacifica]|uniref:Uncharacterized protein n=1 Tax=Euzebya pacifica TaxID=1608957 RepID=A0A346XXK0_9ACTN|nr:hypothetical protein DVS28_a2265 [Euzebya pacifica]
MQDVFWTTQRWSPLLGQLWVGGDARSTGVDTRAANLSNPGSRSHDLIVSTVLRAPVATLWQRAGGTYPTPRTRKRPGASRGVGVFVGRRVGQTRCSVCTT